MTICSKRVGTINVFEPWNVIIDKNIAFYLAQCLLFVFYFSCIRFGSKSRRDHGFFVRAEKTVWDMPRRMLSDLISPTNILGHSKKWLHKRFSFWNIIFRSDDLTNSASKGKKGSQFVPNSMPWSLSFRLRQILLQHKWSLKIER